MTFRTTLRDKCSSRQISLIGLPREKYARRILAIVSTTSIPIAASQNPGGQCGPNATGSRLDENHPRSGGPYSMKEHTATCRGDLFATASPSRRFVDRTPRGRVSCRPGPSCCLFGPLSRLVPTEHGAQPGQCRRGKPLLGQVSGGVWRVAAREERRRPMGGAWSREREAPSAGPITAATRLKGVGQ